MSYPALERAIEIADGQSGLARALRERGCAVSQGHVWYWLHRSRRVPAHLVEPIEIVTGGRVPRAWLRPDLYPSDMPPAPAGGEGNDPVPSPAPADVGEAG